MMIQDVEFIENFYERLCPNILECDFPKKVCALQCFINPEQSEIFHILLVGDPASGKSELMNFIAKITPNSGFVGKHTTRVGLIEELENCDRGIMGIDEFDKLPKEIRNSMLEMMQSQQVKIAKFGMHVILKTRTNVLAVCNPRNSILSELEPVHHQLSFSNDLPLLTRFALIVPFYALSSERYADVAESNNYDREEEDEKKSFLKKYLVKTKINFPKINIDNTMARRAGDFVHELKQYSPMSDILSIRTVVNGFMTALKASARMNWRDTANEKDFIVVKNMYEQIYAPEGVR